MPEPVKLTWVTDLDDYSKWVDFHRPDLPDGVAQWKRRENGFIVGIMYCCPCGCKDWRAISVSRGASVPGGVWGWDGNETEPTLTPSIQHGGDPQHCHWHGYLRAGVWVTA